MKLPYVVSISGISGSGKTTIVTALKERLANSAVIYWDDYGDEVDSKCDIYEWAANGSDCNEWNTQPVANDIERLLNESYEYIILDYPFGYLNECVGKYINLTIFIDTPLDVALARRIVRDYTSRSRESDFGLADVEELSFAGLDKELRWYLTNSRPIYANMIETHKPVSDLVIDGTKTPNDIVETIVVSLPESQKTVNETDEQRRARIYPIILSEYNPAWPKWYMKEKANLERLIGTDNISRTSHFGSTSVPGLTAKPTVDILLEIKEDVDIEEMIAALPSPEYICLRREGNSLSEYDEVMIIKGDLSDGFAEKVYHIHVRYPGDYDELYFRDYLIANPEASAKYAALKRGLFENYEHDRDGYTEAKGRFIKKITNKSRSGAK